MKKIVKFIPYITSLLIGLSLYAQQSSIEPYKAPYELQLSLDAVFNDPVFKQTFMAKDKEKLALLGCTVYETHWGNVVVEHKDVPGYLIKGEKPYQNRNWKRVLYGQAIRDAIGNNSSMIVATEYVYRYPGHQSTLSSENYCIISKKIAFKDVPLATFLADKPTLIKDMQTVMKKVGYWDPGIRGNIFITLDDKIAFVDTEPYPDDHNFVVQPILNLIFFRRQERGAFTAQKLYQMVELARNPLPSKSALKTIGKYTLYSLAVCLALKIMHHQLHTSKC